MLVCVLTHTKTHYLSTPCRKGAHSVQDFMIAHQFPALQIPLIPKEGQLKPLPLSR